MQHTQSGLLVSALDSAGHKARTLNSARLAALAAKLGGQPWGVGRALTRAGARAAPRPLQAAAARRDFLHFSFVVVRKNN